MYMQSRRRIVHLALAPIALAIGCIGAPDTGTAGENLLVTSHCSLSGAGTLPSGDSLGGDVYDDAGSAAGGWTHDATGGALVGVPSSIECRMNGERLANVSGTGSFDGAPGYTWSLHVQDRGDPTMPTRVGGPAETRTIVATRTYSPSRWTDGEVSFAEGALVAVPATLPVTVGNAGNQWARLTFVDHDSGEPIRCSYRGGASRANPVSPADIALGTSYSWARCERWDATSSSYTTDASIVVGSVLDVDSIAVHVQHGSSRFPASPSGRCVNGQTTVSLSLTVTPMELRVGEADYYRLLVFDPAGSVALVADGDLASGDLAIALLP